MQRSSRAGAVTQAQQSKKRTGPPVRRLPGWLFCAGKGRSPHPEPPAGAPQRPQGASPGGPVPAQRRLRGWPQRLRDESWGAFSCPSAASGVAARAAWPCVTASRVRTSTSPRATRCPEGAHSSAVTSHKSQSHTLRVTSHKCSHKTGWHAQVPWHAGMGGAIQSHTR